MSRLLLLKDALGNTPTGPCCLVLSYTDGSQRAAIRHWIAPHFAQCWAMVEVHLNDLQVKGVLDRLHVRLDLITDVQELDWATLKARLAQTKRNYFRHGIALGAGFDRVFLETELNANAMLLSASENGFAQLNSNNFSRYGARKYGADFVLNDADNAPVWIFSTQAAYLGPGEDIAITLQSDGPGAGSRQVAPLNAESVSSLIKTGSSFLTDQVKADGQFVYGLFPCFDKEIPSYNCLRHASSTYAMIEAWEVTQCPELKQSIDRALHYLTNHLIKVVSLPNLPVGNQLAFLVDTGNEIKLGGNAVCVLALCKYTELTGDQRYLQLMAQLAHGMAAMFNTQTGRFVHVLNFPELTIKEVFRIIYYDGEAAFALMRLYRLTRNPAYLQLVERAFEYFIQAGHDKSHDHWLSYCVNELTIDKPLRKYFEFGVRNFQGYLDFVLERITTFPTLLELMMAAEQMLQRMKDNPALHDLLLAVDLDKFYRALHFRANHLASGYFWPEWAMFFQNPQRIVGSFFIRHHSFRVRIDDVEHYLSGLVAYRKFLLERKAVQMVQRSSAVEGPILAWGGDVNLGRRMHERVCELDTDSILNLPAFRKADFALVNLECVVALAGEQGVDKGEGGSFYFRAKPEMLEVLKHANIHAVISANNHSGDYGSDALVEQAYWLEKAGLKFAGSGRNSTEAMLPLYTVVGNVRVAIFGFDSTQASFRAQEKKPGTNFIELSKFSDHEPTLREAFKQAKAWADLVIVAIHWGPNFASKPTQQVRDVARRLIDLGVNAILGSSSHVLQGVEIWKSCPIIYDAGDLLFDSRNDHQGKPGAIFSLRLSRHGVTAVEVNPLRVAYGQTTEMSGEKGLVQLNSFADLCRELDTFVSIGEPAVATIRTDAVTRKYNDYSTRQDLSPTLGLARLPADQPDFDSIEARWVLPNVPDDAKIEPIQLGPLLLKGFRIGPRQVVSRTMVWVESFWELSEQTNLNLSLDIQVVPVNGNPVNVFGLGCDHHPCDWLKPTTEWEPGHIYRDRYGLRPPKTSNLKSGDYCLSVRVLDGSRTIAGVSFLQRLLVDVQQYTRQYRVASLPKRSSAGVWTADELLQVTGGEWVVPPPQDGKWHANGVVRAKAHSRFVDSPCLFVASNRENLSFHEMSTRTASPDWDRHDQLQDVQNKFCGAIVRQVPKGLRPDFPLLKVDDPIRALMELGAAARARMQGLVVAVTGSAGKSSVVGMANHVATGFLKTSASYDNYNSRVGMLICLSSMAADTELAILEVAVSAINAPEYIPIKMVCPDIAVITNIAASHLKPGETLNDIARRKANIMLGVRKGGTVVLNRDDRFFDYFVERANKAALQVISVGRHENSDVRLIEYTAQNSGFQVTVYGRKLNLRLGVPGEHMALNACFVLAILSIQGQLNKLSESQLVSRFVDFDVPDGRGNRLNIGLGLRKIVVVNEAYNANPSSMKAALSAFEQDPTSPHSKVLILGDMLELGDLSAESHLDLVPALGALPVRELLLTGSAMKDVHQTIVGRQGRSQWFENIEGLTQFMVENLRDADVVMMKASNGIGLYKIIDALKKHA